MRASGPFDVTIHPLSSSAPDDALLGRRSIAKVFRGDLEGTAVGEMLTAGTAVQGSGAYVAVDRVTGTLHGRTGSFTMLHTGLMTRGTPQLSVAILADSGSGALAGITGSFAIRVVDGQHFYDLDYTLSEP